MVGFMVPRVPVALDPEQRAEEFLAPGISLEKTKTGSKAPGYVEGMTGIEPASSAWKAEVLATIRHPHRQKSGLETQSSPPDRVSVQGILTR